MLLKDPGRKKPVFSYHTNLICERQGLYVTHFCVFVCGHCLRGAKLVSAAFALGFTPWVVLSLHLPHIPRNKAPFAFPTTTISFFSLAHTEPLPYAMMALEIVLRKG